jgi:hypothetical protein
MPPTRFVLERGAPGLQGHGKYGSDQINEGGSRLRLLEKMDDFLVPRQLILETSTHLTSMPAQDSGYRRSSPEMTFSTKENEI